MGRPSKLARRLNRNRFNRQRQKARKLRRTMNECGVCRKPDHEKPMCFRKEPWCSENHRKQMQGDRPKKRW